jgi:O-antigen/teichoic acid export membrane protein
MIRTTVSMFLVFAGFGLGMTATKHVAECRLTDPERAGRIMAISGLFAGGTGTLVAVGLYLFAPWVATHTINAPQLVGELRIGAFILLLNAMNGAQTGALAGFEAFRTIAKVNFWTGLASFPLLIGGAYWWGLRGAVWALGLNMVINWLLNHLALRREAERFKVPFSSVGCFAEWPILWRFSLPAALGGIMVSPVVWAGNAMLVNQPGGYGQMGMYDAANQWRMAILFIPGVVGQIVLPTLANLHGLNDQIKYRKALKYNVLINGGVSLIVALPVVIFATVIMRSYGPDFEEGALALILLSISTLFVSLNNVVGQAIASKGLMWVGFCFNLMWATTFLIFSYYFIHNGYGVIGLALANLIAYLAHSVWQSVYFINIMDYRK